MIRSFILVLLLAGPVLAAPPELAEIRGALVLTGGREIPADARKAFFDLAGKEKAKIVVIPADADTAAAELKQWDEFKVESKVSLHTTDPKAASQDAFVEPLTTATGVWIANGNVDHFLKAYKGTNVESELKKLLARGGVIGGSGGGARILGQLCVAEKDSKPTAALGLLPGFLMDRLDSPDNLQAEHPSMIGLRLPDGSACVVRGRTMRVIAEKPLTVRIARGAGWAAMNEAAGAGAMLDLFQLRRAAANRAEKAPFPPAQPPEPVVKKGSLVIVGGGGTTQKIMNAFFDRAGGKDALIVVIPTTEQDGPGDALFLRRYGATNLRVLFTLDRKKANDPAFSEVLTKAGGVWFGGGRQWRFVDSFEGTLVEKRFHEVLERGGVIGGSSAGASIQSEYMPRGHPLGNTVMAAEGYERGFGFLPGCAVDQHFFARGRPKDMTGLMKLYPQYLGIGIDEATAIVVTGSIAEVVGTSRVAFYDTKKKGTTVRYDWDSAGRLVWVDADYVEGFPGEKYDLRKRAFVPRP